MTRYLILAALALLAVCYVYAFTVTTETTCHAEYDTLHTSTGHERGNLKSLRCITDESPAFK